VERLSIEQLRLVHAEEAAERAAVVTEERTVTAPAPRPRFRQGVGIVRPATEPALKFVRDLIAKAEPGEALDAIRDSLNAEKAERGFISSALASRSIDALKALPKKQAEVFTPDPAAPHSEVWPGTYTLPTLEGHRTFKVIVQRPDAEFAPGQTILAYLSGSDNESNYTSFAFIRGNRLSVWNRFKGNEALIRDAEAFLADPDSAEAARNCLYCGRKLTTLESIARGIGPECNKKGWG
jgi:hypothetical protein